MEIYEVTGKILAIEYLRGLFQRLSNAGGGSKVPDLVTDDSLSSMGRAKEVIDRFWALAQEDAPALPPRIPGDAHYRFCDFLAGRTGVSRADVEDALDYAGVLFRNLREGGRC